MKGGTKGRAWWWKVLEKIRSKVRRWRAGMSAEEVITLLAASEGWWATNVWLSLCPKSLHFKYLTVGVRACDYVDPLWLIYLCLTDLEYVCIRLPFKTNPAALLHRHGIWSGFEYRIRLVRYLWVLFLYGTLQGRWRLLKTLFHWSGRARTAHF